MNSPGLLSALIFLPAIGGLLVMLAGEKRSGLAAMLALVSTIVCFLLSLKLLAGFDVASAEYQLVEKITWVEDFNIWYHLGVDGFSVPLILMSNLVMVLVVIAGWHVKPATSQYMAAFLFLQAFMTGVFCALDAILFYIFFEGMLIPMFLIIGLWGGQRKVYAAMKFFLYTFLGSVFMLLALIYLYIKGGSFAIEDLQAMSLGMEEQTWIFLAFLIAFAVKVPMWPVHTWLPDAHVEAPTGGSVILAAVMLKVGGYGFIRFSMPVTPDASLELSWLMVVLSLVAVVYIGFVAMVQADMKKLIAYSSISHMGFVSLGLFALLPNAGVNNGDALAMGISGAMVQMISHGFISAAMFLCVGVLYDRMHTRLIADYGGVANQMPWFTLFVVLFGMANAGLPGTSGFVGEFMVIVASFQAVPLYGILAALTLILGAAYTLWMVKRVMFGEAVKMEVKDLVDIGRREALVLVVLAVLVISLGVWPAPLTEMMDASVAQLMEQVSRSKLPVLEVMK